MRCLGEIRGRDAQSGAREDQRCRLDASDKNVASETRYKRCGQRRGRLRSELYIERVSTDEQVADVDVCVEDAVRWREGGVNQ